MALSPGTRLGVYEITAKLGEGGMGAVFRARDTKLDRDVAIKILPEAFAHDADRLARFTREAKTLASLNHPNIAGIYGLEESGGVTALVMELVEGEDLSTVIARGPLPLSDALPIARQIADALEAAHEQGIIHRDLKPANIKVRPDGTVKVLDFGLAKALGPDGASATADAMNSPTLTSPAMTEMGMILGTAAYMAPEQARGRAVDRRADIWAFGCVVYEMVTGRRAFSGEDITETLAAVVMKDPALDAAPAEVRPLLAKCLQKDPKKRLRDISGVESLLDFGCAQSALTPATAPGPARAATSLLPWGVAAALAVTTLVAAWALWRATPATDRPLVRLDVELGPGAVAGPGISAIPSPEGNRVVYVVRGTDIRSPLVTRRLDQKDATPLLGTESLFHQPFFSPDGQWVGFRSAEALLKKVSVQGGSAVVIGPWPGTNSSGASWGDDGNIVIGTLTGLVSVPSSGGPVRQLTHGHHRFPDVLPGAKAVLYADDGAGRVASSTDSMTINVLNIETGETRKLLDGGYWPRYLEASPGSGYLTYVSGNALLAVGFDPERLQLRGAPVPVLDDVAANGDYFLGGGQVAVSRSGTLVYLSGGTQSAYPLVWIDGAGAVTRLAIEPGLLGAPRVSPDGKSVAYLSKGAKGVDVWVYDVARRMAAQRTFLGSINFEVAWAPDSAHLVYGDGKAMWWTRADGAGQPQRIADTLEGPRPFSFAPLVGGKTRLAFAPTGGSLPDVMTLAIDMTDPDRPVAGVPEPFLTDPAQVEVDPAFSPDGRFIAYALGAGTAGEDIYVRPFPGPGGQWKVSNAGGKAPVWSRATHQLLFMGNDDRIMAVEYTISGDSFSSGAPHPWSSTPVRRIGVQQNFDLAPEGTRIIAFPRAEVQGRPENLHATFLLNFGEQLRRRFSGR